MDSSDINMNAVAIVAVHGRFPGANDAEAFWENLVAGRDTVTHFSDEQLRAAGLDPAALRSEGHYVAARGVLENADCFDAAFFGIHDKEAEVMDPQHRVFLEACWEALERAGYDPARIAVPVGIFAGATHNTYYMHVLHPRPELRELVGRDRVMIGNEKDYLATRVAYKLDLRGPAITLNTACSSSLVAIVQAYQALLTGQCDMALAGGVSVSVPQVRGYFHQEGDIGSPDGHTRTFDADGAGTVFGNGVGVVVLKRLEDALRDSDTIWATIVGAALNNDGSQRVSFGAPGVEGQAEVVSLAQGVAGVMPEDISYVEAHGTATPLGDPIEIAALTKAFRRYTDRKQFCAIGSVKSNIGHLDAAAGAAGLIKVAMSMRNGALPASLHFRRPNPKLDLDNSPFFVNAALRDWKGSADRPRRAGISSFGTGGTNAHLVVEEAPAREPTSASREQQVLTLSAKTAAALDESAQRLAAHLRRSTADDLADVAFTLGVGRSDFSHRRALVCRDRAEAIERLEKPDPKHVFSARQDAQDAPVVFMFPGQGAQYVGMGAGLYEQEPAFRDALDRCARILAPVLPFDLLDVMFARGIDEAVAAGRLQQTRFTQPALFSIEYALACLWMSWGVRPAAMIGHSVGEFVAATLAGVFALEDALRLVARRAELVDAQPSGAMLAVRLPEGEVRALLDARLSIAAVNSPSLCVVSGPHDAVAALEADLKKNGTAARRLHTSHAFHSSMMDSVVAPFEAMLRATPMSAPQIPYVSNVTAGWITAEEAMHAGYWATHLRDTVRFADGVAELLRDSRRVLLEVGPGRTLTQLATQHPARRSEQIVTSTTSGSRDDERASLAAAVARLWIAGAPIDWAAYYGAERRRRIVLPTYPFEKRRHWPDSAVTLVEPNAPAGALAPTFAAPHADVASLSSTAEAATAMDTSPSRKATLLEMARSLMQELSGVSLTADDTATGFIELGLDSLLLTQAATVFQRKFGVPVSFRQLMENQSSLESLVAYLDERLPAGAFAPQPPFAAPAAMPALPAATPGVAGGPTNFLEALLQQNLLLTTQMLQWARGGQAPQLAAPVALPVAAAPAVAAPVADASARAQTPSAHGPFRPLDKGNVGTLSDQQQAMLDALIAEYTRRTAGSKRLAAQNRPNLADPRSASGFKQLWKEMVYPIYAARSDGALVWDIDGNEYLDFVMGFGACYFGHRPPFVVDAVKKQLDLGFEIGPIQAPVGEVAAMMHEMTGLARFAFCNTGSEAVMAGIRVARTVTGRDRIVTFSGSYHGMFDEVLVRPLTENGVRKAAPIAPGIPFSSSADVIVLDYGNPESLEIIRQRRDEIAAVLVEPVQGRRLELQPREFMLDLRRVTEELDIALLFDEVVTGFRVHPGGAQAYFGVRADLATYGKIVGGGLPIGVLGGSARFMDALDGGQWQFGDASFPEVGVTYFAGTFVRHPLAIAAAKAVLEYLKAEGPSLQQRVTALTTDAADRVRALADRYGVPLAITNFSGQMQVNPLPAFRNGGLLYILLRLNGIHIYENRGFIFTTAHTTAHVDQLVAAFETTFRQLVAGGFLPEPSIGAPAGSDGGTVLALTEPQREMCAAALMGDEANCSYNQCFALTLDGPLDAGIMRDALADVVRRHEALRLSIDLETESQRVLTAVPVALPVVTLDREEAARKAALDRIIDRETRTPFDLSKAPLWRAELVRESATRHVLVFTAHHVVVDGWSSAVIFSDLAASYIAHRKGVAPALPPAASYRGFVAALESPAVVSESEAALDYWATQYATGVPSFELPLDHARPPLKSYTAGRHVLALDDALLAAVRAFAARQGCTPFVALLAVFEVLVARLTGADDLTLGIPMASQTFEENGHLVAHGVNTIPLRGHVDLAGTFSDHLLATRRSFLDAQAHWRLTFGTLVQKLRLPRDPSRTPLVSITFNVDKLGSPFDFGDLSIAEVSSPKAFFNFDLGINAIIDGDRLVIECDYNADLFDADTIESWMTYYRELLRSAAANPAARIADISLLSDAGRTSLRDEATAAGPRTSSAAATLLELVEAEAQRAPDRIAVECDGRTMSYGTLWSESATIARTLLAGGLARGERVGLCMPRGLALPAALLGILRAGGAYVPLDRSFPDRRLQHIVERAGLRYIVIAARDELPGAVVRSGAAFVDVDALDAARADATPLPEIGGDDLAYVLFTSGSTGQPKGVRVLHRNLGNFLASMREAPGIGRDDVLCAVTTLSFDIAGLEMYLPLVAGARIRIASDDESIDPQLLARALRESRATMLQTTPTLLRMLVDAGEIESLRGVRLLAGGEMLPRDLAGTVLGTCRELWNMYGPTETTIWSTLHRVASVDGRASTLPLGRPIANTWIHIVDASGQPVPRGVHGEIWIGGDGVADGYLDDATRTAERFGDDPFVPGQRMYRTGDVGSLKDGLLYFHGRADDQIKLRGFRIELGDIEAVAFEEPDVREAAAAVRDLGGDDKRLVLYVTARRADPVLADRLTERLRDALPPYMRPNHIAVIETMPHTPNGKVDRRALPAPEIAVSTKEHVAPRSPNEALVVGAFNAALGRTDVGVFDDFFDLGGHSLMAARVMANLSAAAKVALPLRNLFERPTPAQLAAAIDALGWASAPAEAARVTEGREEIEL